MVNVYTNGMVSLYFTKRLDMQTIQKAEQLNIRASAEQKAKLAEAARIQNMNVSQFVLSKSLDAAEEVIADQRLIRVSKEEYDWLLAKLEEPPKEIPALRELFSRPSVFES
jgi:uncharacterized protein (DUF1778 family)